MARAFLATYLNDHLAGSVAALELLEHLERPHEGSPLAAFVAGLRADIAEDQRELEALIARLGITQSPARKAAAWLSEKLAKAKLMMDDIQGGPLKLLEGFEALSLGIEGKRLLWRSLGTAAEHTPDLGGVDYARLVRRAEEQRSDVEALRLESAKAAFADASSS